ncbi:hypothetical protein, partial [uncultured Thiodictyon sp.]|uniref:hypothetical protein n=1 Tax=uncultured Thiodictyon sp. TaxID=1846217 RepID=UPI0025D23CF5
ADAAQSQPLEETMLQSTRELVDQVLAWRGNPSNRGRWGAEVQTTLETNRNLSLPLLRLLLTHYAPAGRKHTPLAGYDACLALLGASLRRLRLETERRWPWAIALCEQVQTEMAQLGFVPEMDSRVQDDLLRALYDAKLEMTLLMHERALAIQDHYARFGAAHGGHDLNHLLERMRRDLDTDDAFRHLDPVLAHLSPLPGETLVRTVAGMMVNPQPIGKELAMLLLLQPDVRVRRTLAERFRSGGGVARLTQRGLRRLIGLRNWLPADERPAVDELIKVVRRAGVVSAPLPQVQPAAFYASPFDGWGGYRLWAFVKDGQHHRMGAVLIRQGLGVVEISWQNGLTKDAMDEEVRNLIADSAIAVDPDFVPRAIAHFIAVGLDQGYPPPPHLLELNELVGGDYWKPAAVDPAAAIAALTATDPAAFTPERVAAAFAAADTWPQEQGFAGDWIEEGAAVNQLLLTEVGPPAHWVEQLSLAAAVITIGVMEHKRDLWIERLLWEALRARRPRQVPRTLAGFSDPGQGAARGRGAE